MVIFVVTNINHIFYEKQLLCLSVCHFVHLFKKNGKIERFFFLLPTSALFIKLAEPWKQKEDVSQKVWQDVFCQW